MGFIGRLKDVMSGKIAKSNALIGDHGLRIDAKVKADPSFMGILVGAITYCTTDFLTDFLFQSHTWDNYKYKNGDEEPNPFKKYIDHLDRNRSYEMFKLVAGNFFVGIISVGLLSADERKIHIPELMDQFFTIFEYTDEDKEIFHELLKIAQVGDNNYPEWILYDYIFQRAYRIAPPEYLFQKMNFVAVLRSWFGQIFLPGLSKLLNQGIVDTHFNQD